MTTVPLFLTVDDFETHASRILPRMVRDYYNGGSMDSITLKANREAYNRYYIRPRVLRNVKNLETYTKCFLGGNNLPMPLCVAPAAMQKMAHPDGEEAMAKACGRYGTVMGLSTFSTSSLEDVAAAAKSGRASVERIGDAECVLQMYLFENRDTSVDLIRRAEKAGFKAVVLTVDTPQFGRRLSELRNKFKVPPHLRMANFASDVRTGSELRTLERAESATTTNNVGVATTNKNDASLTWEAVSFLRSVTSLPV
jgi:(S)-2-hydroxy-acid oxidase